RFIKGEDRTQVTLLPACLDDYIEAENPVRVVEVFVDGLDLDALGFVGVDPAATGRPAYHPAMLLKLYIYGYLNRIQSSRRMEREAQRNVELMWLTGRRQEQIEESIQRYLKALQTANGTQPPEDDAKTGRLREKTNTWRDP